MGFGSDDDGDDTGSAPADDQSVADTTSGDGSEQSDYASLLPQTDELSSGPFVPDQPPDIPEQQFQPELSHPIDTAQQFLHDPEKALADVTQEMGDITPGLDVTAKPANGGVEVEVTEGF